jgi:hypothetical protein
MSKSSPIYKYKWTTYFSPKDLLQVLQAKVTITPNIYKKEYNGIPLVV